MTDQDVEELTGWLRERMPGHRVERETMDGTHRFEVRESESGPDDDHGSLALPTRFSSGSEWPTLDEVRRALETASVATLLPKGRRLALRGETGDDMRKVWVEDAA